MPSEQQLRLNICLATFLIYSELPDKGGREAPQKQAVVVKSDQLLKLSWDVGRFSSGPCRHHTSYRVPRQQQNAGSAIAPDGKAISDNSSEAMTAREKTVAFVQSLPPCTFPPYSRWWLHAERLQTRRKCQNRPDKMAATGVLSVMGLLLLYTIQVPQVMKGVMGWPYPCPPVGIQTTHWCDS